MKNDIVRLIISSIKTQLKMHTWQVRERVKEQNLLIEIAFLTDAKTSETIRDILMPEKNDDTFYAYLYKLKEVLYAISMGIPTDTIISVIDNRITNKTIYTLMEEISKQAF